MVQFSKSRSSAYCSDGFTEVFEFLIDLAILVNAKYFEDIIILRSLLEHVIPLSLRTTKDEGFSEVKNKINVNKTLNGKGRSLYVNSG